MPTNYLLGIIAARASVRNRETTDNLCTNNQFYFLSNVEKVHLNGWSVGRSVDGATVGSQRSMQNLFLDSFSHNIVMTEVPPRQ